MKSSSVCCSVVCPFEVVEREKGSESLHESQWDKYPSHGLQETRDAVHPTLLVGGKESACVLLYKVRHEGLDALARVEVAGERVEVEGTL